MVEFNTILSLIQATGIIVGVAYYIMNIQNNQRNQALSFKAQQQQLETRQTQLMMQIYDHINNKEFNRDYTEIIWDWTWRDWDEYLQKYGTVPEEIAKLVYILTFFEGVGVLVEQGLINSQLVGDMMGNFVLFCWAKLGQMIIEFRKHYHTPDQWMKTEYLYGEMLKHYERVHGFKFSPSAMSIPEIIDKK